jgi:molybdopterin synthase catalytic subunit
VGDVKISVQAEPFDYGTLSNAFAQGHTHVGAVVTFCGIVRDDELGGLSTMEIEHYPGMTEKAINAHSQIAKKQIFACRSFGDPSVWFPETRGNDHDGCNSSAAPK